MLHRLPTELSVRIIETAAYLCRFSDRQSVVNLAMSCRTVYDIVCPVLHHTLILTDRNAYRLVSLASDEKTRSLAERILSHVRCFHNHSTTDCPFDPRLLVNIESVETCSWPFINSLVHTHLKTVYSVNLNFLEAASHLAPEAIRVVTHITGHLPMFRKSDDWNSLQRPRQLDAVTIGELASGNSPRTAPTLPVEIRPQQVSLPVRL